MRAQRAATLVLMAMLCVPGLGRAGTTIIGTAQIGNPASTNTIGIVEALAPCNAADDMNGLDGVWLEVSVHAGRNAVLAMTTLNDFDLRFYDAECAPIDYAVMGEQGMGQPEVGTIPAEAAFVIVNHFSGHEGRFELTIS